MQLMKIDETTDGMSAPPLHLGHRLRIARLKHGLSQAEVAERLSVTGKAVSIWENGAAIGPNNVKPLRALLDELERSAPGPEADPVFALPTEPTAPTETETPTRTKPGPKPKRRESVALPTETSTPPEKTLRERYLEALFDKLPPFDGTWSTEAQDRWLSAYQLLLKSVEVL